MQATKPKSNVAATGFITNYWKNKSKNLAYWQERGLIHGTMTREKALFKDEYVELFASQEVAHKLSKDMDLRQMAERFDDINPIICPMHPIRHRYFNKSMKQVTQEAAKQVVILGAGFDTRAVRKHKYNVRYFEVDQPEVLGIKAEIYAEKGVEPNAAYIGINYVEQDLMQALVAQGLDLTLPTHFIWEGNVVYLPMDAIKMVLGRIKQHFTAGATISFDYFDPKLINKETAYPEITEFVETFTRMGAQFKTGIADIYAFAKALELDVVDNYTGGELVAKYGIDDKPDARLQYYSLCTLKTPG